MVESEQHQGRRNEGEKRERWRRDRDRERHVLSWKEGDRERREEELGDVPACSR